MKTPPTWEQLIESINSAKEHPADTQWLIYQYINHNIETIQSEIARRLLAIYFNIPHHCPSLLHSCILTIALKVSGRFMDFKLPHFIKVWGYPQSLRPEDCTPQTGKDGRTFLSLKDRTERALKHYALHNADQRELVATFVPSIATELRPMVATKIYETERNGRRMKSVKMVAADGQELLVDSHLFKCKPWEIAGRTFDVLLRTSKEGNLRAEEVVASQVAVTDIFPPVVGYVDRYDMQHQHYHIFDSLSRHFVAERPSVRPMVGGYVAFSPIIPKVDKFKSAIIARNLPTDEGREAFGIYDCIVKYVNTDKGYFFYTITSAIPTTPEGTISPEGSASLSLMKGAPLAVGQHIRIIMFLKRGKDGTKRNSVVEIL